MARKNSRTDEKLNYSAEIKLLKEKGPGRLYFLWGPEDYLREQYLSQLKKTCIPEEENDFSYRKLNGPELNTAKLKDAIDAIPFMTERSFAELRDIDINKLPEGEECLKLLSDIPEYCTVAFVQSAGFEPDGRIKFIKGLRGIARELKFTQQSQSALTEWIARRFAANGKRVDLEAAQRLIFISGDLMSRLIPEIEKIAAYTKGDRVTVKEVEAVANHIPEAVVFEMTELISQRKYNASLSVMSELLCDKNNEPIMIMAVLGMQMRKLYAARLAIDEKLGANYVTEVCSLKADFIAAKLMNAAKGFSLEQLKHAVELCCEADYRMKSSGADARNILKETVLRIASGETDAEGK